MEASIGEVEKAMTTLGKGSPWSADTKVSDDFLDPVFASFFKRLNLPNLLRKTDYHVLARHLRAEDLDPEMRRSWTPSRPSRRGRSRSPSRVYRRQSSS